jgi:NhaA family Na+:H+ antiporter
MKVARRQMFGGLALFAAAAIAMLLANSSVSDLYRTFATIEPLKGAAIFLFFLSVGIELRHEIVAGSLRKPKQAVVPIFAAFGGLALPVVSYSIFNAGTAAAAGWGVPMSSDMAFALGILAIAGRWLPKQIRTYVLTVAVVDDSTTILIIAIFYASSFHLLSLASLAGVIVGLLIPKLQKIQTPLEKVVAYAALPLFALMSAGVDLSHLPTGNDIPIMLVVGILVAMIIGKPLGVIGMTWLVVKSGLGSLPQGVKWKDLAPALLVFGMCFTLAMVMTELSFGEQPQLHALANLVVVIASLIVALISSAALTARKLTRVE